LREASSRSLLSTNNSDGNKEPSSCDSSGGVNDGTDTNTPTITLPTRTIQLGEGTILGAGVFASMMVIGGAWPWKDTLIDGAPSVGAVSPITVAAAERVKV
jgi:hypothetical protein